MSLPTSLDRRQFLRLRGAVTPAATISDQCLALRGVICDSCRDICEEDAIRFTGLTQRVPTPAILSARCTGCGECAPVCPSQAIHIAKVAKVADA
jgi:ferredoxin-type protein NapF